MKEKRNRRKKPQYKAFIQLSDNVYGSQKIENFLKKKWKKLQKRPVVSWVNQSLGYFREKNLVFLKKSYKENLQAKQKIKIFLGNILDKQIKKVFREVKNQAKQHPNVFVVKNFMGHLESRLDIVLLRLHFTPTIHTSRQWVKHGFVYVNGNLVTMPGFLLKEGDIISLNKKLHKKVRESFLYNLKKNKIILPIPPYLEIDLKNIFGVFIRQPKLAELYYPVRLDYSQITRYYKK